MYPQFIDNKRKTLADTLRDIAKDYDVLRIATGYWDLAGTLEIINEIKNYKKIQLLIGQEPLADYLQKKYNISDIDSGLFPDTYVQSDLEGYGSSEEINALRETAKELVKLIEKGVLEVKVFRKPRLHAKVYIFGDIGDGNSVGIIGSSNFTGAGLSSSKELNFLTNDYKIVEFVPSSDKQENGHLTWFKNLWEDENAEDWTGDFTEIISKSPVGNMTYGPYDVYIKTLMEVFPDELIDISPFDTKTEKILYEFQNQNALSLRRKLEKMGVAMLSDSVGLGKTITAAAIINQYINDGKTNIVIIPPASLKQQWVDELESDRWNLVEHRDFEIYNQQDKDKIAELIKKSKQRKNTRNEVDLFVVDEAHNLRNVNSVRHQQILELFQENPHAKVLLLTATPINNSLMDFANIIQLGSKGDLVSVNVPYQMQKSDLEYIDFFKALRNIQSEVTRAEKRGERINWDLYKNTLTSGIRHYIVRSTRQGVEKRNAMKPLKEGRHLFPETKVEQISYSYGKENAEYISNLIVKGIDSYLEGLDPRKLNLDFVSELTQRTEHPIDLYKKIKKMQDGGKYEQVAEDNNVSEKYARMNLFDDTIAKTVIPLLYQLTNFIGFAPYKPDAYRNDIYGKTIPEIRAKEVGGKIRTQLAIHNMLHVTWLKRLESSMSALEKSVKNYERRLELFEKWLDRGYIISLSDISTLENDYGEDINRAFDDYEKYLEELDAIEPGNEELIKKKGIEKRVADESEFRINKLKKDLDRDKRIVDELLKILDLLIESNHDEKLNVFANNLVQLTKDKKYGKKVLVFSFFSDTIDYLKEALPPLLEDKIPDFSKKAVFVSGNSKEVELNAKRFSPKSKKYKLENGETELDYLFATDVLSEGQNLQDAGILVNYDLHWNPVRMIQRNGRINRLGSPYDEVLIANEIPNDDLEAYLKLVRRLERKIDTINFTVGNDQSVLGEEANPIEFNDMLDFFSSNSKKASEAAKKLENQDDPLTWTDDYSLELRQFLEDHKDDGEIERIKSIPKGKWNYLPKRKNEVSDPSEVIGLYTALGKYTGTGEKIRDVGFVKIKFSGGRGPFKAISAEYIDEQEALKMVKTDSSDNRGSMDTINLNRKTYIHSGEEEIGVHFKKSDSLFKIEPKQEDALKRISTHFTKDVLGIVRKGIKRSNEKRIFDRLAREINREVKEGGAPFPSTVRKFEIFINRLLEKEAQEQKLNKIEGVLFYAHK